MESEYDAQREQAQMTEQARLLWRYHDWLTGQGYALCERRARPEPGLHGAYIYQPVRTGADLVARFLATELELGDQRQERQDQADG